MNSEEIEVQRLKNLVKDLELQNSALRSKQQQQHQQQVQQNHCGSGVPSSGVAPGVGAANTHPARRSFSSDGEDDFFDLSSMGALDDDITWLYSSPAQKPAASSSLQHVKKEMCSVFESPEILPRRRALSHKLREIERGSTPTPPTLFPLTNGSPLQSPQSTGVVPMSSLNTSLNGSYTSDSQSSAYTSTEQTPDDKDVLQYMHSVMGTGSHSIDGAALKSSLTEHSTTSTSEAATSHALPPTTISTVSSGGFSSGTFTRPKKKAPSASNSSTVADNNVETASSSRSSSPSNDQSSSSHSNHDNESKHKKSSRKGNGNTMAAGDSATYVLQRNKTRTIEASAVLEAQRRLTDSSSSLDQSDSDSVGALPGKTFRRRVPTGNQEDKSKRESLDIQTLARLQEQSLRDSLAAVRKASTSSAGSAGVPALNISDLDSSTGSLSSNNEDAFHQHAEEKSMQGSGTFRIKKSPRRTSNSSPTLELNGDTPIIHKSVVNSRSTQNEVGSGRRSPQIRSSLSPRTLQAPKASGLRKPNSALSTKTKPRSGGIPVPAGRTGLRPPTATQYSSR